MAVPELVIANSPYKVYPGGVIVFRATDWMAGARGTLSSEASSQAIEGEAVRDSQKVSASIWLNSSGVRAYDVAADTLVIDLEDITEFEAASSDGDFGMTYQVLVSLKIEGDWDVTNSDTTRGASHNQFLWACQAGFHGDSIRPTDNNPSLPPPAPLILPRNVQKYSMVQMVGLLRADIGNETIHFRFYSQSGTTIQWLIDQIIFLPLIYTGSGWGNNWAHGDIEVVSGGQGDASFDLDSPFIDGADGGTPASDGIYTRIPFPLEEYTDLFADAGGDYQKKTSAASAEYMTRLPADDLFYIANVLPEPDKRSKLRCYGLHGARYREARVHVNDDFSRTVNWPSPTEAGSNWESDAKTPGGFALWAAGTDTGGAATYAAVDGTQGILHMGGQVLRSAGARAVYGDGTTVTDQLSARLRIPYPIFSGQFRIYSSSGAWLGSETLANTRIQVNSTTFNTFGTMEYAIWVIHDSTGVKWYLAYGAFASFPGNIIAGPFDISSWLNPLAQPSNWVGWKIEIKRYVIRCKVWNASAGSEPGAWDVEAFRPIFNGGPNNWIQYPYTSDPDPLSVAYDAEIGRWLVVASGHGGPLNQNAAVTQWETQWDNIKIEENPYGSPGDTHAYLEQPETGAPTNFTREIELPYGADYLVYWGTEYFTEASQFDDPDLELYLDFAAKTWNDIGNADHQRAELPFFWFRSIHGGPIDLSKVRFRSWQLGDV